MSKLLQNVLVLITLLYWHVIASANTHTSSTITIQSIHLGKINSDKKNQSSTVINFINNGATLDRWQLGFYMPGTSFFKFVTDKKTLNADLDLQICDQQQNCSELEYEKAANIRENDSAQGYSTILAPKTFFPLLAGKSYVVNLLHGNRLSGKNFSHAPQNIFFILPDQKIIHRATTEASYTFADYDQNKIDATINQHILKNWDHSIPYIKSDQDVNIIPSPVSIQKNAKKNFSIRDGLAIHNKLNTLNQIATLLARALQNDIKISASIDNQANSTTGISIEPVTDVSVLNNNPEGYILEITANKIKIQANNNTGVYYAYQTLRQLWNNGSNNKTLPAMVIIDYPRFKYRGLMLDVTRHFFSVTEIKTLIDIMGTLKLNTLHLHLADDEAFRLSLSSFPTLKSIAATRGYGLPLGPMIFPQGNLYRSYQDTNYIQAGSVYSGSYDASDVAEIIAYANDNQITVIPELDLPSHARALIKALPDIFIDPSDYSKFVSVQGYTDDAIPVCIYNTTIFKGQEFTTTLNDIMHQVANLFNGQSTLYAINHEISLGGDEVSANAWTNDSSCQGVWKDLTALQKTHKFFQQIAKINPDMVFSGWQELVQTHEPALGDNIIPATRTGHIWVWHISSIAQASNLANNDYPTVLAYADQTYFDLTYTPDLHEPGFAWASSFSDTQAALSSAISATSTVSATAAVKKANIIGIEGALWSENLANYKQMIYMALPKMTGLAEASWSSSAVTQNNNQVNWQSLAARLGCSGSGYLSYLNKLYQIHYRGYPNGIKLEVPAEVCA
jgi:hexosaminidase